MAITTITTEATTTMVATPPPTMVLEAMTEAEGTTMAVGTTMETAMATTMTQTTVGKKELVKSLVTMFHCGLRKNIETCKKTLKATAIHIGTGKDFGKEAGN